MNAGLRCVLGLTAFLAAIEPAIALPVVIASKQDAETAILAELAASQMRQRKIDVEIKHSLGGTPVVWQALLRGDVQAYPEYTGTISQQLLHDPSLKDVKSLRAALAPFGIGMTEPLGFANNYALGMTEERAESLGIQSISDLASHPQLRFGFSTEFLGRADCWLGLKPHYRLPQTDVRGLDHQLAYLGLSRGDLDVTDLYTTDAEIRTRRLRVLRDDRNFFPKYEAVFVYRLSLRESNPAALEALKALEGTLSEQGMIGLNERAKSRIDPAVVAAEYDSATSNVLVSLPPAETWLDRLRVHTIEHVSMVSVAVLAGILVGVPLGIIAARRPRLGGVVLAIAGIVQTIPALALLALMIPLPLIGGTGVKPALIALVLYGLLPIVRNTLTGLRDVPANLREAAAGLGLSESASLRLVELPMASRAILGGIKTSAVITVGTATLGALIGAGGYGQEILRGVQLNDPVRILEGAIPSAVLALLVEAGFSVLERLIVPRGLRIQAAN